MPVWRAGARPRWAPPVDLRPVLDRWILSRAAGTAATVEARLLDVDAVGATRALSAYLDELSTWYLRMSRRRFSRPDDPTDRDAAFATLHEALAASARMLAPILPFLAEALYDNLVAAVVPDAPDSVHLTRWPTAELAGHRDEALEASMARAQGVVDLARTLRASAHLKTRQPLATAWIAMPDRGVVIGEDLLRLIASEINVKEVVVIDDDSALVERRVKPLLPRIGARLGSAIPQIMAAARAGEFTIEADGSVTLAGVRLAPDEVEIQATPRPGTAVAHHDGLVVVLDTSLTPALVAEGDARELARAVQDLRREAGLELDDRIELWVDPLPADVAPHLDGRRRHARRSGHGRAAAGCAARVGRARRRAGRHRPSSTAWRPVRVATRDADAMTSRHDGRARDAARRRVPAEHDQPTPPASAVRSGAHWLVFIGLALGVVIVDQLTKAWLVANLSPGETMTVIGDWVRLVFSQNSGALFGLFRDNAACSASPRWSWSGSSSPTTPRPAAACTCRSRSASCSAGRWAT